MRDVLVRLMEWMETSDVTDAHIVLRDAITEIAGLRARLDEHRLAVLRLAGQDATLSVQGGNVTVTTDATLTDAEREAIHHACGDVSDITGPVEDTLRGLLERTGGER